MEDAKIAQLIQSQQALKIRKENVGSFVKLLNVQKMKLSLKMEHAKHAHLGQCPNRVQECVDQVFVVYGKGF